MRAAPGGAMDRAGRSRSASGPSRRRREPGSLRDGLRTAGSPTGIRAAPACRNRADMRRRVRRRAVASCPCAHDRALAIPFSGPDHRILLDDWIGDHTWRMAPKRKTLGRSSVRALAVPREARDRARLSARPVPDQPRDGARSPQASAHRITQSAGSPQGSAHRTTQSAGSLEL